MDTREKIEIWASTDRYKSQIVDYFEIVEAELAQLKKQLNQSQLEQRQLELALCHTEDAISITNCEDSIRMVNPAFERLTGYCGAEIIGETHKSLWLDPNDQKFKDFKHFKDQGVDWRGVLPLKTKNGKCLITEMSVAPVIDHMGHISHYVYSFHDITDQMALEKSLHQQKSFLEKIINLSSNLVVILDQQGKWLLDNLAAKTLFSDMGERGRDKLSQLLIKSFQNESNQQAHKLEVNLKNNHKKIYFTQYETIPADYLNLKNSDEQVYLITLSDITESEMNNRNLLVQQKALISSNIEKNMIQEELVNGITYRLQQPLNVSKAILTRMRQLTDSKKDQDLIKNINNLNHQFENIRKELAAFNLLYNKNLLKQETTKSKELLEAVSFLYQKQQESIDFTAICERGGSVEYPLAYEMVQLMLKILIDNALESVQKSKRKKKIKITFEESMELSSMIVEDSGCGIDKKELYKIFEPFHSTKENHSGLSLTLLHQMLNKVGGLIDIESSVLGGASFIVSFPKEGI